MFYFFEFAMSFFYQNRVRRKERATCSVLDRECIGVVMDSDLTVHLIAAKTALTVTVQCLPPLIMLATSRKKEEILG